MAEIKIHSKEERYEIAPLISTVVCGVRLRVRTFPRASQIADIFLANGRMLATRAVQRVSESPYSDAPI